MKTITVDVRAGVATVRLSRGSVRNAFDETLIEELTETFARLPAGTRAAVLAAEGPAFCAGADLAWMQRSIGYSDAENLRDARALAALFDAVDQAPCAVVGRVQGAALGGGAGLVACCDVAIAIPEARFGFPEVRLGLAPAVISPYVIRRIGAGRARRYFVTGEVFDAAQAHRIGLVDEVVAAADLDAAVARVVAAVLRSGPRAVAAIKHLVRRMAGADAAASGEEAVRTIAELRVQPEAQEGMRAFLEKREPRWG